jgi:hypothetical protein
VETGRPLRPDEDLQGFAVSHGPVAAWDLVQADGAVEHSAGFDRALKRAVENFRMVVEHGGLGAA